MGIGNSQSPKEMSQDYRKYKEKQAKEYEKLHMEIKTQKELGLLSEDFSIHKQKK